MECANYLAYLYKWRNPHVRTLIQHPIGHSQRLRLLQGYHYTATQEIPCSSSNKR